MMNRFYEQALLFACLVLLTNIEKDAAVEALTPPSPKVTGKSSQKVAASAIDRRDCLSIMVGSVVCASVGVIGSNPEAAHAAAVQDSLDVESFMRTGVDAGGPMGVSSQAGKSKPLTGVIFRDGSEVSQDGRGSVSAEILTGKKENPKAVLVSFVSPWKLQTGSVFDVECRDPTSGDTAFLAVTQNAGGKSLADLPSSFFLDRLFDPTGRFSLYGAPTDIKVKKSRVEGNMRFIELGFANLSQATNAEIPRRAVVAATIPEGSDNAIMLVGSTTASRWKKGGEQTVASIIESFRAVEAPKSSLKIRPKRDDRYDL